jgi:hypothetical protein
MSICMLVHYFILHLILKIKFPSLKSTNYYKKLHERVAR